jgi:hypothetical protein
MKVNRKRNNENQIWVPYNLALLLKNKGFDKQCRYHYKVSIEDETKHSNIPTFVLAEPYGKNHNTMPTRISAPEWSLACDWIYEKYEIVVIYNPSFDLEFLTSEFENALKNK